MRRVKKALSCGLLASIFFAHMTPAQAASTVERPTVIVSYGGSTYSISSTLTNYVTSAALFREQPWWGNPTLAAVLSGAVGTSAGGYADAASNTGILFVYGEGSGYPFLKYLEGGGSQRLPSRLQYNNCQLVLRLYQPTNHLGQSSR